MLNCLLSSEIITAIFPLLVSIGDIILLYLIFSTIYEKFYKCRNPSVMIFSMFFQNRDNQIDKFLNVVAVNINKNLKAIEKLQDFQKIINIYDAKNHMNQFLKKVKKELEFELLLSDDLIVMIDSKIYIEQFTLELVSAINHMIINLDENSQMFLACRHYDDGDEFATVKYENCHSFDECDEVDLFTQGFNREEYNFSTKFMDILNNFIM